METKEIDGVLYGLVPEEEEKSCKGCAFYSPSRAICTTLTDNCNKGFVYKKIDGPISTSNLKPFNLEAAKAGKPICTRDGRKARIICFDKKGPYPIIALIETEELNGEITEYVQAYDKHGHSIDENTETKDDLVMLYKRKEKWINIYKIDNFYCTGEVFSSKKMAEFANDNDKDRVALIKISWEES